MLLVVSGELSASVDIATPGRYCLEIRDGKTDSAAPTPYAMTTRLITPD